MTASKCPSDQKVFNIQNVLNVGLVSDSTESEGGKARSTCGASAQETHDSMLIAAYSAMLASGLKTVVQPFFLVP
jgi:hypothetical protein